MRQDGPFCEQTSSRLVSRVGDQLIDARANLLNAPTSGIHLAHGSIARRPNDWVPLQSERMACRDLFTHTDAAERIGERETEYRRLRQRLSDLETHCERRVGPTISISEAPA
jgi:hypothetical protein